MGNPECTSCFKPKATLQCGHCHSSVCKNCAQFLDDDSFSFSTQIAEEVSHTIYCNVCFDQTVAPALDRYNDTMEKAKEVLVFSKNQTKETRLIKRLEDPVKVHNCQDHDETILRLAFLAVQAGYNGLVDLQITSEKVKNGSYQTMKWSGIGIPAFIDEKKLPRDRSIWQNPN